MATLTITRSYNDGEVLLEADLDDICNSVETFLNTTKISDDNIQNSGITASTKLIDGSISTAKIADLAISTAKIAADAITGAKIGDDVIDSEHYVAGSIDAEHLASSSVETAKINDLAVTTGKINDSAVTAAKIATGVITQVKMGSLGQQVSASCGTLTIAEQALTDVTNLSVSITTTGRPVFVGLIGDTGASSEVSANTTVLSGGCRISILRGASVIANYPVYASLTDFLQIAPGAYWTLDVVSAGTYTYKVQALVDDGTGNGVAQMRLFDVKLVAFEL